MQKLCRITYRRNELSSEQSWCPDQEFLHVANYASYVGSWSAFDKCFIVTPTFKDQVWLRSLVWQRVSPYLGKILTDHAYLHALADLFIIPNYGIYTFWGTCSSGPAPVSPHLVPGDDLKLMFSLVPLLGTLKSALSGCGGCMGCLYFGLVC